MQSQWKIGDKVVIQIGEHNGEEGTIDYIFSVNLISVKLFRYSFDFHPDQLKINERAIEQATRNKRARENRKARDEAMKSIGMVKVRGNLGGIYYE